MLNKTKFFVDGLLDLLTGEAGRRVERRLEAARYDLECDYRRQLETDEQWRDEAHESRYEAAYNVVLIRRLKAELATSREDDREDDWVSENLFNDNVRILGADRIQAFMRMTPPMTKK